MGLLEDYTISPPPQNMEGWQYICRIFSSHTQLLIITKDNTDDIMRDSEITTDQRRQHWARYGETGATSIGKQEHV